ncbi:hypothetical protein JOB18_012232 [Solea senegalensis]|uniref:Uncharacterized protein n=1 Tax=Solea senegalensis TaxID=28829 RepID=A0AAV6SR74_SOLSE|nr:hypothetical protein JOB18_012232 [Solea senegalensis]
MGDSDTDTDLRGGTPSSSNASITPPRKQQKRNKKGTKNTERIGKKETPGWKKCARTCIRRTARCAGAPFPVAHGGLTDIKQHASSGGHTET